MTSRARHHVAVLRPVRHLLRANEMVLDYGCCTECGGRVTGTDTVYEEPPMQVPGEIVFGQDLKIRYHILRPCAHTVDTLHWITQGYESIAVNDIVTEERHA